MIARIPGCFCSVRSWCDVEDGTLARLPACSPAIHLEQPVAANGLPVTEDDKAEFKLLKNKIADKDVTAYVKHRNDFFRSPAAYISFAAESDKELDGTEGLRRLIELSGGTQTVFYRWVRKAYMNQGVTDVPGLIKRGKSSKLQAELDKVKKAYGKAFSAGGFNPRPKKNAQYQYLLGTISEHGMGTAIDVEDAGNPIISKPDWDFIEKLAVKHVDLSLARWKKDPEGVWKDINGLNALFVKRLTAEMAQVEKSQEKPVGHHGPELITPKKAAIDVVLADHDKLKPWRNGFFTLEWSLVSQLHEHGFRWGATFYPSSVDLHHFELMN